MKINKAILLFRSLTRSFEHFKDVILYDKEGHIASDEVQLAVRYNEFSKVCDLMIDDSGEGLSISRWGSEHRRMPKSKSFDNSKVKWFTCHKTSHFIKDYTEKRGNVDFVQIVVSSYENSYERVGALIELILEIEESWRFILSHMS